ncbi:hypothetical protein [Clostridium sp. AN503]|uniref:hypothetical protein n=1 Tax=Clostridium sp. AN503 TaxID=3160598 RepID=UPI0034594CEA
MKKQLTLYAKQAVAMFLAVITFLNIPLYAYADVHTSSDSQYNEEPFYYDENGTKIYDSDIDWSQYRSEPDYSDILWTFEEYPETMMTNGEASTYVIGIDDAAVAVIVVACAACGYYIAKSDIPEFVSKGFEPWLRRNKGADVASMSMWQDVLSSKLATEFTKMTLLIKAIREYLDTLKIDSGAITVPINSSTWNVTSPLPDWNKNFADRYFPIENYYVSSDSSIKYITSAFALSSLNSIVAGYVNGKNSDGSYFVVLFTSLTSSSYIKLSEIYNTLTDGYWRSQQSNVRTGLTPDIPLDFIYSLTVPIFVNAEAYNSWKAFGTTGGLLNGNADDFLTINTANQWTDLQQNFFTKYAVSDVLKLPETQAEFDALIDSLSKVQTGADVITTLKPVWDITENTGGGDIVVVPSVAYSSLCYIISAIASYCGASLTDEQKNTFISSFYTSNIDGTSALVEEQAQEIIRNFVVINGGSQKPDDNNDNNKYKILKKLAVSVGAFLVSVGLVSDIPDFENEPSVSNNVQVVEKQDSGGSTSPDANIDLSGILNYLKQFLTILNNWSNPLALMDSLISKLGLSSLIDGIKTAINNVPKLISGELSLPELFGNVTDAIFSMPQQVADAIAKALGLEKALDNLGLSELFDNIIELLPGELVEGFALPDLFSSLGTIVGSIPLEISKIFGLVNGFSLNDWLNNILQSIQNLPSAFAEKFPSSGGSDNSGKEDGGDSGFRKFINALILLALILVVLLIFFLNCLRFIVLLFQIPASAELFNEDILAGMNFLRTTMLPVFNVSLYSLLMGAVYFVVFMSIIGAIRKKINHLRIPAN